MSSVPWGIGNRDDVTIPQPSTYEGRRGWGIWSRALSDRTETRSGRRHGKPQIWWRARRHCSISQHADSANWIFVNTDPGRMQSERYFNWIDPCLSPSVALITPPSASRVIGCAIRVHRTLGAGLFESVYQPCLAHEMRQAGLEFSQQVTVPLRYGGLTFQRAFRMDFLVENELIVEVKALEKVLPVHASQVLTYLRLTGIRKGLLINFNVPVLKEGLKSFVA